MNLPFFIARKYLLSKKKQHIINIISIISVIGVLVSTAALIIVLSVFNGFQEEIKENYSTISPDLSISKNGSKSFDPDSLLLQKINSLEQVQLATPIIKDHVVLNYNGKQTRATAIGIKKEAFAIYQLEGSLVGGAIYLENKEQDFGLFGTPIAQKINLNLVGVSPVEVYTARKGKKTTSLTKSFHKKLLHPAGVFFSDPDFSSENIIVSFDFAQNLFDYQNRINFIEIKLQSENDILKIQEELKKLCGTTYTVRSKYELNESLYKMLKIEKLFVFFTLALIFLIAAFNIMGSVSMIILDKKSDIATLQALGASQKLIKSIFIAKAMSITLIGVGAGLIIGLLISWLQQTFEWINLYNDGYTVIPFSVSIQIFDILMVLLLVLIVGFLIAILSVRTIPSNSQTK